MMALDRWVVERFHRVLVEEIRHTRPEYLEEPFTVAEIYQALVPYRTHRDRIGVELNGDYEEALLHLLGGEGGLVDLESGPARERIRQELKSKNPNTGIFREFAAVTVRLNAQALKAVPVSSGPADDADAAGSSGSASPRKASSDEADSPAANPGPSPAPSNGAPGGAANPSAGKETARASSSAKGAEATSSGPGSGSAPAPDAEVSLHETVELPAASPRPAAPGPAENLPRNPEATGSGTRPGTPSVTGIPPASAESAPDFWAGKEPVVRARTAPAGASRPSACPECASELPDRANLRFCPFCGVDVFLTSCGACGEEMDRRWSFCIACGTPAAASQAV
jgi:hypothetical protein